MSPRLARQFSNSFFYEGAKAKLLAAETESEVNACARMLDTEAFAALPADAQTELLALFGGLMIRQGAFCP